jgi:uncharacterized repeat protein (TIGR02543 family)
MVGIYVHTYISLMKERFMKKLFSRKLFAMLAAVTLVTAALVTSCDSPIEGKAQKEKGDGFIPYAPPAGMGYIKIKVLNNARTILPTLPAVNTLDYRILVQEGTNPPIYDSDDKYDPDNDGNGDPIPYAKLEDYPIEIVSGTYKVTVTAYNPGSTDIVGYDEVSGVVVGATGKEVPITLKPQTDGSGTFTYNIGLPSNRGAAAGTFTAVLAVRTYPDDDTTGIPAALQSANLVTSGNNSSASVANKTLPAGFYYVTITMTDPGIAAEVGPPPVDAVPPALQDRIITNILHIYDNIDTSYPATMDPLNSLLHTVTYNGNGGNWSGATTLPVSGIVHGTTLTLPTAPTRSGYTFNGTWARDNTSDTTLAATKWSFSNDTPTPANPTKLIGPVTLYAMWTQQQTMTLNLVWADPSDAQPTLSPNSATLHQADYYGGANLQTTLTCNVDVTEYAIQEWRYKGASIGSGASITVTSNPSAVAPAQYISDILAPGSHVFTIIVKDIRTHLDSPTNSIPNLNLNNIYDLTYTINVGY